MNIVNNYCLHIKKAALILSGDNISFLRNIPIFRNCNT